MQLQKDVLIAGGVVVVCVALVVVALVATGKKDTPAEPVAVNTPTDNYSSPSYGDPTSFSPAGGNGSGNSGGFTPVSPVTPTPVPGPTPVGLGPVDGPSAFDTTPLQPVTPALGNGPYNAGGPTPGFSDPANAVPTPAITPVAAVASNGGTHTVAKGETLGDISATHYGTTKHWRKIVEANPGLDPARLKIGQVLQIPAVESTSTAAVSANGVDTYTVKKGESYYTIAKKVLGSSSRWREIERLNSIPAEELRAGTVIKLPAKDNAGATTPGGAMAPAGGGKSHVVAKGETLGDISKTYFGTTTKWKQIVEANPGVRPENLKVGQSLTIPDLPAAAVTPGAVAPAGGSTYTVKAGDTLESIAASTLGKKSAWKQLVEANPGLKPTSLRIGQVLAVPGGSAVPAPALGAGPTTDGFSPLPGANGPAAPAPVAPPAPTFKDDPFYSPYDAVPAPAAAPLRPGA